MTKKKIKRPMMGLLLLTAVFILSETSAQTATQHDLAHRTQTCSDCHTMHYSEGAQPPTTSDLGGPFNQLLLKATTNKICLFCHDGTDVRAPDVLVPVTMYGGTGDEHSGGGYFEFSGGTASSKGHDLDVISATVPFSSLTNVSLTCASCHDPHGTDNFRNLLTAPAGGTGTAIMLGVDVFTDVSPTDPPTEAGSIAAYKESNIGYKSATSAWCMECHDQPHHPRMSEKTPQDVTHWTAGLGAGFGVQTGDEIEGIPRLRFQNPAATEYTTARTVGQGNQGICETCHLAHGGPYLKGLVWPYRDLPAQADTNSGCYQCHGTRVMSFP